jgi:hypothetical protein
MSFDVREDALVVDNDGVFSDCQEIEKSECPWKLDKARQHRCDFHRFRRIASGDKRGELGTTGAFGIGFIAVYQITDRPELISAGRHWILNEDKAEDQRIQVCSGCPSCSTRDLPATRFILPWARDPDSTLRKALRAEAVSPDSPRRMAAELEGSLTVAMLFLKRLRAVDVRRAGRSVRRFERLDIEDSRVLRDVESGAAQEWHIIRGEFSEAASRLHEKHLGRIEPKRSAEVTLAIPKTGLDTGLLCACLPTEQSEGLPFHLNADFFTTNDRKRVIFAADYQSEWNREALKAGGRAIRSAVGRLPSVLGAKRFWQLVSRLKEIADGTEAERREPTLAEFWNFLAPSLGSAPVIQTSSGEWATPAETCLLLQSEEAAAVGVVEALGVRIAHEHLRPFQSLLRSEAVGVPTLDIKRICDALVSCGLDRRTELGHLPVGLDTSAGRAALWNEINRLLERNRDKPKVKGEDEHWLREVALAPGRDEALWPCKCIHFADQATVALFEPLALGVPFVAGDSAFAPIVYLCNPFDVSAAVEALKRSDGRQLERLWQQGQFSLRNLFEWFENRRQEILSNHELKERLAELPLFPSSGALHRIGELALPGDFTDPLGLTELVDLEALGRRREFLQDLGMPELDFATYVTSRLPNALCADDVSVSKRRAAVLLLAERVGELKDSDAARNALVDTALIECTDGVFRKARECYFDSDAVRDCLGDGTHLAALPQAHEVAVKDFYAWLGVASKPRFEGVVTRIHELISNPYSPAIASHIQRIVAHLGDRVESGGDYPQLDSLSRIKWLPARGRNDRWYAANELYAEYQAYLFESQAQIVDVPATVQRASRPFLEILGVHLTPAASLVVKHLLHCASQGIPVNTEVYRFLNDKVGDPALGELAGRKCLWVGDHYCTPCELFWGEHPFGRYRKRLGDELRVYSALLKQLGVCETPTWEDAVKVLREIAKDFGSENRLLDDEAHAVLLACWRAIGHALDGEMIVGDAIAELRSVKCVPNASRKLHPPEWMFFENRAGLAVKFGRFLTNNVIPRPIGTGRALDEAGVRALGTAVRVALLECNGPIDDPAMSERVRARINEIGRVLEASDSGHDTASLIRRLEDIRWQATASIQIEYRLSAFNQELQSPPEHVPALYTAEDKLLLFTNRSGVPPWAAIARELATALFPEEDPGRFAAGLKEVLAAESVAEAESTLDELGFARLDTDVAEPIAPGGAVETLGTKLPDEGGTSQAGASVDATDGVGDLTPGEAVGRLLGEDAPRPTPPVDLAEAEPLGTPGRSSSRRNSRLPRVIPRKGRPVLRSYLPAPANGDSPDQSAEEAGRSPVDEAGVRHVMEFESAAGRTPKEMPHKNPGYDIESRGAAGRVIRYIEVKSLSGPWSNTYAVLSRPQFDKAREVGAMFWLYVVECAESKEFRIHRIPNPALSANHFMFDDGWRATAEGASMTPEEGE